MERRMLVAIALSFAVIMLYMKIVVPAQKKEPVSEAALEESKIELTEATPVVKKAKEPGVLELVKKDVPQELSTVNTQAMDVTFSTVGGCIQRAVLKRSDIVKKRPVEVIYPLSTIVQPVTVTAESPVRIEPDAVYKMERYDAGKGGISYSRDFGPITIRKTYSVPENGYVISMKLEMENNGSDEISFTGGVNLGAGGIFALKESSGSNYLGVDRRDNKGKVIRLGGRKLKSEKSGLEGTEWLSLRNQFFTVILKPEKMAVGFTAESVQTPEGLKGVRGGINLGRITLKSGEKKEIPLKIYIGPKEYTALTSFGASQVIDLGWFGFLGKWILKGINILYGWCGNYGVAIILITILIRLILYPLNQKSFRSMKGMQKLQPKIAELQAKLKDDPKKKQQEMMKIYKEHGINPMGGCFPMLLQMPILIAFFRVLQNSIELWGAPFVLWIKDLAEPDALLTIPTGENTIPFIGRVINGQPCILLNVLPLLMLLVFFIQQKMSSGAMATSPEQAKQQKMMSYMMPIMFGFIFYNMPAGLNLYFTTSTLLGIIQQKYLIK